MADIIEFPGLAAAPKSYMRMKRIIGSSNVKSVGYSKRNQELGIRFISTPDRYFYSDVPFVVYQDLLEAPSKGKFVHQYIKGYYPYRRENYSGAEHTEQEAQMPATSQAQQRYFGWLYSKKKSGDTSGLSEKDRKTLDGMTVEQLRDFAATKRTGLPIVIKKEVEKKAAVNIQDLLHNISQNQFIKHVGGGALLGIPLGAAYYGALGSEMQPLKQRLIDGAQRGAIGGAALGTLYHIGRNSFGMPRFKDLVGNRVPRY